MLVPKFQSSLVFSTEDQNIEVLHLSSPDSCYLYGFSNRGQFSKVVVVDLP